MSSWNWQAYQQMDPEGQASFMAKVNAMTAHQAAGTGPFASTPPGYGGEGEGGYSTPLTGMASGGDMSGPNFPSSGGQQQTQYAGRGNQQHYQQRYDEIYNRPQQSQQQGGYMGGYDQGQYLDQLVRNQQGPNYGGYGMRSMQGGGPSPYISNFMTQPWNAQSHGSY